jgi:hypothetical protein
MRVTGLIGLSRDRKVGTWLPPSHKAGPSAFSSPGLIYLFRFYAEKTFVGAKRSFLWSEPILRHPKS